MAASPTGRTGTRPAENPYGETSLATTDTARMVGVPTGRFEMGIDDDVGFPADGEGPRRAVDLDAVGPASWWLAVEGATGSDRRPGSSVVEDRPKHPALHEFGMCNVAGNVREWCADWLTGSPPPPEGPLANPTGPAERAETVTREGSYLCHDSYRNRYRVAARRSTGPTSATGNRGLRCALGARDTA